MTEPALYRNETIAFNKNVNAHMSVTFWTMHREVNCLDDAVSNKLLHQTNDREAIRWANGDREWARYGLMHRDGGKPSFEGANGARGWQVDGLTHRHDGPACIDAIGTEAWYQRGYLHREDGAALTQLDGGWAFIDHDRNHRRDDLPAIFALDHEAGHATVEWHNLGLIERHPHLGAGSLRYWPSGAWRVQYWWKDLLHNDLGPADILVRASGFYEIGYYLKGQPWFAEDGEDHPGVEGLRDLPPLKPILPMRRRQQLLEEVSAGVGSLDPGDGGLGLITPLRPDHQLRSIKDILEQLSGQRDPSSS
jgi:hypothetical protein